MSAAKATIKAAMICCGFIGGNPAWEASTGQEMGISVHRQAIDLLLLAMYRGKLQDGAWQRFLYGPPGSPDTSYRLGIEITYKRAELIRAVLFVRKSGPHYLKNLSVHDIWNMLLHFISNNYWFISDEVFGKQFTTSYGEFISEAAKSAISDALAASDIFRPTDLLTLYPLVPIQVEADFDSAPFFLIKPGSLDPSRIGLKSLATLSPETFPPLTDWVGKVERPSAWLGVRSPAVQSSNKMKAAILGALALAVDSRNRHQFSMRHRFGGRCTFTRANVTTVPYGDAHVPALSEDIEITEQDYAWLRLLAHKLLSDEQETRRHIRALEYFFRAWPLDESERFPLMCMTLDALFGDASAATQSVVQAVEQQTESDFKYERLRLLLSLRGSVIHGGAPDVYDSEKYQRYYETHGEDPIRDMEMVTAVCLRAIVFLNVLVEHPDPYADLVQKFKEGSLSKSEMITEIQKIKGKRKR